MTGEREKVAVLGGGAWGTALAKVLADKGNAVSVYCRSQTICQEINEQHTNTVFLPSVTLPPTLTATPDLEKNLHRASMVLFVVPSHATREVARLAAKYIPSDVAIVSATKGIENGSLTFVDQILDT